MQRFDCLSRTSPLLGPHFLEASAGTGKTFAIEHIVARLLLEGFSLEQILIVTFTKAAARELKLRIRCNLEKVSETLKLKISKFDYLEPYLGSEKALRQLNDALTLFDRAQIFTIHGFCYRMLKEYPFEAGLGFSVKERTDPSILDEIIRDFLESKLSIDILCPEQLGLIVRDLKSVEALVRRLKRESTPTITKTFTERLHLFSQKLNEWVTPLDLTLLKEDFAALRSSYKAEVKGRFEEQLEALAHAFKEPKEAFRALIAEKGTLLSFLSPSNRKIRVGEAPILHYPTFFDWARQALLPLIEEAADPKRGLETLLALWRPIHEKATFKEESFGPDEILQKMRQAVDLEGFKRAVQMKYRAALIDEFQDTDPKQWTIFQTLFLAGTEALYLVGDPKQSIYRFRNADLYTYLAAKKCFASEHHFHLDTNFRSSKPLIDTLNRLFDREWLTLPQEGRSLPYYPVRAGAEIKEEFEDGKGAVHCFYYSAQEVETPLIYIAEQIQALRKSVGSLSGFAVLVKDRYTAAAVQSLFAKVGIKSMAKSREALSESLAFEAMEELLQALHEPKNMSRAKTVLAGPLANLSVAQLQGVQASPFVYFREILDEKGFPHFCRFLWTASLGRRTVQQEIESRGEAFASECGQVLEALFGWEQSVGFSLEGALRFLDEMKQVDPDDALTVRRESDGDAVQIMTMHVSKGLEFDVVFALGLSARTIEADEEVDAEKLRQLYVAMTRAKRRLYIPLPLYGKEAPKGVDAPIELFCKAMGPNWKEELERLGRESSLTIETVKNVSLPMEESHELEWISAPVKHPHYVPSYLLSFTALTQEMSQPFLAPLAPPNGSFTPHNLPRGAETGVAIHSIFERYFIGGQHSLKGIVNEVIGQGPLASWKEAIISMVEETLDLPLPIGVSLRDLDPRRILVEREFFFEGNENSFKGFIDLIFEHEKQLYIVDWKTNWLGESRSAYIEENLKEAVRSHQYDLQAKLYRESLKRTTSIPIGGSFFIFVRGPQAIYLGDD